MAMTCNPRDSHCAAWSDLASLRIGAVRASAPMPETAPPVATACATDADGAVRAVASVPEIAPPVPTAYATDADGNDNGAGTYPTPLTTPGTSSCFAPPRRSITKLPSSALCLQVRRSSVSTDGIGGMASATSPVHASPWALWLPGRFRITSTVTLRCFVANDPKRL